MDGGGCPFINNPVGVPPSSPGTKRAREDGEELPSLLGFATSEKSFLHGEKPHPTHYGSYLGIPQLLKNQEGEAACKPGGKGLMHHEELTFIVIHQVFELWFKLTIADMEKSRELLKGIDTTEVDVRHQRLDQVNHYLRRAESIFRHVMEAFGLMETMHPADFIEFRDYLIPASGFQSVQFRQLEQIFGVQRATRCKVNGKEVFEYLETDEQSKLAEEAKLPSFNIMVEELLSCVYVPETFKQVYYETTERVLRQQQFDIAKAPKGDKVAEKHVASGLETTRSMLEEPVEWSEGLHCPTQADADRYTKSVLAALFVSSYRHEPKYALLASFIDQLIATEQAMLLWRGRHMHMAERMIGRRAGTGGTGSGVGYLDMTRRYRIFHAPWLVRKLFIRASALPPLSTFPLGDDIFTAPKE